jgi:hypothetical protein
MAQNKFVGLTFTKKRRIDPALKRAFNVRSKTAKRRQWRSSSVTIYDVKNGGFRNVNLAQSTVFGQWALNYLFKLTLMNEKSAVFLITINTSQQFTQASK